MPALLTQPSRSDTAFLVFVSGLIIGGETSAYHSYEFHDLVDLPLLLVTKSRDLVADLRLVRRRVLHGSNVGFFESEVFALCRCFV